ncbi:Rieske (2Fe-2S) protein [Aspergillus fischeri NRRL 181]|uniref:Rieske [2Fe-2S] domain protein n=1 Tax=Neosartorya fischeri (strain ATCC 1020 / DSM 3700 / CBS 544.65 / FGSC A1164 / JCM 1740 / NRRL 181 / WB 181) TaxID=331117 RepID=A1DA12_NEOFI|nr:Rieske [2Fe-2S] domain protein [Aspergillus fischeri NRRL 181]EAW20643.1 Rieske [2Fe-2S] domain protein [Aspergillus fischeri NRRL 181]
MPTEFTQFVRKSATSLTLAMNPFRAPSRLEGAWHKVGLASTFPDVNIDYDGRRITAKCKAFRIPNPNTNGPQDARCPVEADIDLPGDLKDQGSLFDIEDFGVVLSAGITCPKHGWSFDLFSGQSDRGNYKLKVWEVQLRDPPASTDGASKATDKEVWVRRKPRIG